MRSKQPVENFVSSDAGNISARAEQTSPLVAVTGTLQKHLRSCGANGSLALMPIIAAETSPLVRSKLPVMSKKMAMPRIISARAEQT